MSTKSLKNIALKDYCKFLEHVGCKLLRTKGGHYQYSRADLGRPLTLQTHISPVPEFIIKNHLRGLNLDKKKFFEIFNSI